MSEKSTVYLNPVSEITVEALVEPIRNCFNQFGGVDKIVKGKVFIKMNATTADPRAITTPEVILATIKVVQEATVKPEVVYVFDNAAAGLPTRVVFKLKNLAKRIKKLGAKPLYLDEEESILIDFNGVALDKPTAIPKILHDNLILNKGKNTYINIPKLKTHLQTGITVCIKNQHGLVYDDMKVYHHHLIDEKIIELYQKFQPDFNLVDATTVLNNGAVAYAEDWQIPMNLILAGTDAVAVDSVCSKLLGVPFENIKYLQMAEELKLGNTKFENIEILPDNTIIDDHKIILNDLFENLEVDMAKNFKIITGNDHEGCRAGCKSMLEYYKLMTLGVEINPITTICGRGHDLDALDKISGTIILAGPCAVSELKEYFENRSDQANLNLILSNDHFGLIKFARPFIKASKIPIRQLTLMMKISLFKLLSGFIGARLHKANYIGLF